MPVGLLNCVLLVPGVPHFAIKVPLLWNFCTRLLSVSVTYTFPDESTAMPVGLLNCVLLVPGVPYFAIKVPLLWNFCTRLLSVSVTYTFPDESTAMPVGLLNCVSLIPGVPYFAIKVPLLWNFCTRLLSCCSCGYTDDVNMLFVNTNEKEIAIKVAKFAGILNFSIIQVQL